MDLNKYVNRVYKFGLTPGFEKLDTIELVRTMRVEVEILYKSLFQPGRIVHDSRLVAKNLANLFIVMCHVAERYNINFEESVNRQLVKGTYRYIP